jgi:hypothetical protein
MDIVTVETFWSLALKYDAAKIFQVLSNLSQEKHTTNSGNVQIADNARIEWYIEKDQIITKIVEN